MKGVEVELQACSQALGADFQSCSPITSIDPWIVYVCDGCPIWVLSIFFQGLMSTSDQVFCDGHSHDTPSSMHLYLSSDSFTNFFMNQT